MGKDIIIRGAKVNNLKNVNIKIPEGKISAFVGVSGSGKTSLVFDTIAAESMHQLYDTFPLYIRNKMPYYPRPKADSIENLTTAIVIDQKPFSGDVRSTVGTMTELAPQLRMLFSRFAEKNLPLSSEYSFNDPDGMCMKCAGVGTFMEFDMDKVLDVEKSLNGGAIRIPGYNIDSYAWQGLANSGLFDNDAPLKTFTEEQWHEFLHGKGRTVVIRNITGKVWDSEYNLAYEGLLDRINRLYLGGLSKEYDQGKRTRYKRFYSQESVSGMWRQKTEESSAGKYHCRI